MCTVAAEFSNEQVVKGGQFVITHARVVGMILHLWNEQEFDPEMLSLSGRLDIIV